MDGVWALLSSVTPGCAFHLPRRNSPARGVAAPEKGRLPLINVSQKLQPRRYGAEMAPFISPPSARARGAGKQQPAPGKPRRCRAFAGRGGSSAAPNGDSAPPDPASSRSLRASLERTPRPGSPRKRSANTREAARARRPYAERSPRFGERGRDFPEVRVLPRGRAGESPALPASRRHGSHRFPQAGYRFASPRQRYHTDPSAFAHRYSQWPAAAGNNPQTHRALAALMPR